MLSIIILPGDLSDRVAGYIDKSTRRIKKKLDDHLDDGDYRPIIVSPVRSTYGGYYGLVVVTPRPPRPRPRPQTLHRSHDNLKNPYRIASIFYM